MGHAQFYPQMASVSHQSLGQPIPNRCAHLSTATKKMCMKKWRISMKENKHCFRMVTCHWRYESVFPVACPRSVLKTANGTLPGDYSTKVRSITIILQVQRPLTFSYNSKWWVPSQQIWPFESIQRKTFESLLNLFKEVFLLRLPQ